MRKSLLAFYLTFFSAGVFAQHAPPSGGGSSTTGNIIGKVVDSAGKPTENASVVLLKMVFDVASQTNKGKLLKGTTTKANGEFILEDIPFSQALQLNVSATGYKKSSQFIALQGGDLIRDLGKIKLEIDIKQLQGVTVSTTQQLLKMDIDKLSFNVEKNMVTAGGTAQDVMRYIPSLQVDIDGNVKLRNATPQLFIDGRPTTLTLDQIPADAIETVEVIVNPSAKYDASGGNAGILNIVLKKNRKTGFNINLRAGIDRRGAINGGADVNLREGKINVSAAFMGMQLKNFADGTTDQFNGFETPHQMVHQDVSNKSYGRMMFAKIGIDYFATPRTTFTTNILKGLPKFKPEDVIYSDIMVNNIKKYANRVSETERTFSPTGAQLGMKHLFPKQGREWTADATYFSGRSKLNSMFNTDSMDASKNVYATELQSVVASGNYGFLTVQTDYVIPIGKGSKLEAGLRASLKDFDNLNETSVNRNSSGFKNLPNAGNNYSNSDNVYAGYLVFSNTMKSFGYQAGVRAERSEYTGVVSTTGDKFKNKYPVSLFPSLFLSKKLNSNQQLQLNYSRRVNRPTFFNLIPFIDRTDPLNYSRGNPDLKPEFTHSVNALYNKMFPKNNNLLLSAYFKRTSNLITRFQKVEYDPVVAKDILVNTYVNAENSSTYGFELTSMNTLYKWWDITTNVNVYNSEINTSNVTSESLDPLWSWFGKINNNFKLPKNYTIQLSGNYQSKSNLPINSGDGGHFAQAQMAAQGYIKPSYGVDLSIRKNFLKNNAGSVTLSFSDIFKTRWQNQHSQNSYFIQNYSRIKDPRMVRLNLSYRFGKADASLFKRKNMKTEGEGMNGVMGQ